jgi:acetolactate synthase I/II/III large subunit
MGINVVNRFAELLKSYGIDRAYGLPGEDHMPMLAALEAAGITYITASNESSAVIMASTDALISGKPGIAIVSMATGVSNAVNGVVHAYMEGAPVLLVSGRWTAARESIVVRQGFDPERLVNPCTKWTVTIRTNDDPAQLLVKAIDIATSDRPGPVYIELPDEIGELEVKALNNEISKPLKKRLTNWMEVKENRQLEPAELKDISDALSAAKRPVVILCGRYNSVTRATIGKFADKFNAPVFTSPGQKGVLNEDHKFFAGSFLNGNPELELLKKADFVLTFNPEGFDILNRAWPQIDKTHAVSAFPLNEWVIPFPIRYEASPEWVLKTLTEKVAAGKSEWIEKDITEYRANLVKTLLGTPGKEMSVVEAVYASLQAAPKNVRITADAGFSKPLITILSNSHGPRHFMASNALSTMGFGIPASVGSGMADSDPVLGFMGDGSMLMRATELVVTRYMKNKPVSVVIMDKSLSQIEIKQERRGLDEVGIELPALSCEVIAKGFGCEGVDVYDIESLSKAVSDAFRSGKATLIGAHVSGSDSRRLFDIMRG